MLHHQYIVTRPLAQHHEYCQVNLNAFGKPLTGNTEISSNELRYPTLTLSGR